MPAIVLVFLSNSDTIAGEWHGIIPLHSTRSDVLRILGEPNSKYDRYLIDGEEATIIYSRGPCLSGWNVPSDTVMLISVTLKLRTKLSDLKINLDKYQRFRDPFVTAHVFYANREEGVRYEVYEGVTERGNVLQIYYEPTSKDEILFRCEKKPGAQRKLGSFARVDCPQILNTPNLQLR